MTRRLLTGLLAILSVTPIFAQRGRPGGPGGGESRGLDYLAGYLGLTESQKTQAQTIFDAAATASETARGQLSGARDALRAAAKANQSDCGTGSSRSRGRRGRRAVGRHQCEGDREVLCIADHRAEGQVRPDGRWAARSGADAAAGSSVRDPSKNNRAARAGRGRKIRRAAPPGFVGEDGERDCLFRVAVDAVVR